MAKRAKTDGKQRRGQASPRPKGRERQNGQAKAHPQRASGQGEIHVQLPKERLIWSFGGLTISVRVLATVLVVALVLVILVPTVYQWIAQEKRYRDILAEVESAQEYNQQLEEELESWSDEDYIAQQARSRLGYVRPGETQYSVIDEDGEMVVGTSTSATASAQDSPARPWTQVLLASIEDADDLEGDAAADLLEQQATQESSDE